MKTAEEQFVHIVGSSYYISGNQKKVIIKAMKQYAKEVAQEALNKAADHVSNLPYADSINETLHEKDVLPIISTTPIVTQ